MSEFETWWSESAFSNFDSTTKAIAHKAWLEGHVEGYSEGYNDGYEEGYDNS
jgi:flagellar biosynthesis/type III secretory pathway protein FliH